MPWKGRAEFFPLLQSQLLQELCIITKLGRRKGTSVKLWRTILVALVIIRSIFSRSNEVNTEKHIAIFGQNDRPPLIPYLDDDVMMIRV